MAISHRLQMIASLVAKDAIVADIGCDHALLPIYLIEHKMITKAYACDINAGPLARAEAAIQASHTNGTISTIMMNGLDQLPEDVTTIVIAGMGFETIRMILENSFALLKEHHEIIVQSNTDVYELRKWINQHGFRILEDKVIEDDHFYHIIKFDIQKGSLLTEDQLLFGTQQAAEDFLKFCEFELQKTEKILHQLPIKNDHYKDFLYYKERLLHKIKEKR